MVRKNGTENGMKKAFRRAGFELRRFTREINRHQISIYAASGAFYMFLSLVPFVILVCSVLPYTSLTRETVMAYLSPFLPESTVELIEGIVEDVLGGSTAALSLSAVVTLWSAGRAFAALIRGLEEINDVDVHKRSGFLHRRLRASIFTLALLAVIFLSLTVVVYGRRFQTMIVTRNPNVSEVFHHLVNLRYAIAAVVLAAVFLLLYKWTPHVKSRYSRELPGAVLAAVAWVIFSLLFSVYVSYTDYGTYGRLATIAIAIFWMYCCIYIILLGNCFNRYLEVLRGLRSDDRDVPPLSVNRWVGRGKALLKKTRLWNRKGAAEPAQPDREEAPENGGNPEDPEGRE